MKKLRFVPWAIIVAFILVLFFQNKDFFTAKQELNLNLYFTDIHQSLYIIIWFLITLIIGFLISYFFGLIERFKLKKTIKGLKIKIDTQIEMISQIRNELESRTAFSNEKKAEVPTDTVTTAPTPLNVDPPSEN